MRPASPKCMVWDPLKWIVNNIRRVCAIRFVFHPGRSRNEGNKKKGKKHETPDHVPEVGHCKFVQKVLELANVALTVIKQACDRRSPEELGRDFPREEHHLEDDWSHTKRKHDTRKKVADAMIRHKPHLNPICRIC